MVTDSAIEAARDAERRLWDQFGMRMAERMIDAAGLRVRMLECGTPSGEPLVFVQGGLGEGSGWIPLLARLTDFRCITLDRPGGGLSDGVDFMAVDVRTLAVDVLEAVMDAAGIRQAAFVANSMGGWWTFQLALRAPARVSRMVMIGCPAVLLNTAAPMPMRLISLPGIGRLMVNMMVPASAAKARDLPSFLGHPANVGRQWSDAQAEFFYRFGNLPNFRRSWLTQLRRFLRLSGANPEIEINADQLQRIAQPTRFLWGLKDPFGSVDAGRAAAALMPDATFEVVGIGHLPWWDDADACARQVRGFARGAQVC